MRKSFFGFLVIFPVSLFCVFGLAADESFADEAAQPEEESQRPVSGAKLFTHEWSVTTPKSAPKEVREATLDQLSSRRSLPASTLRALRAGSPTASSLRAAALASARGGMSMPAFVSANGTGDGLGPLHNGRSCADCHRDGGGAGVDHNVTLISVEPRSKAIARGTGGNGYGVRAGPEEMREFARHIMEVFPGLINEMGVLSFETVVHDKSTNDDYATIRDQLADYVPGSIADEWFVPEVRTSAAIAKRPVVAGRNIDFDFYLSQRNPPPLFGVGVIDRVTDKRRQRLADQQAKEGRVSGRLAGRFGWRGQIPNLSAFVAQACAGELGLTHAEALQTGNPNLPSYVPPGEDMTVAELHELTAFVKKIPVPREYPLEEHSEQEVYAGEQAFNKVGCADCHTADLLPATNIFSDLLLHDMGQRLQAPSPAPPPLNIAGSSRKNAVKPTDLARMVGMSPYGVQGPYSGTTPVYYSGVTSQSFPMADKIKSPKQPQFPRGQVEFKEYDEAEDFVTWDDLQREWRTPPLWGVADTGPYLHDGRAETLEDAIRWHGGEAQTSLDLYEALTPEERQSLSAFLSSLRAPEESATEQEIEH